MRQTFDVVTDIAIYPIKSCQAATVDGGRPHSLEVSCAGFEAYGVRDRDFVLMPRELTETNNTFISQRGWAEGSRKTKFPEDRRLATVAVDIQQDHLAVTVPGFGSEAIGLNATSVESREIDIFGKRFYGVEQGKIASDFFSKLLGRDVGLVRADRNNPRMLPDAYRRQDAANQVSGADGFPFLLVSHASLDEQHRRNDVPLGTVPITRYRGSIAISGERIGAFNEDLIVHMKIGSVGAWVVKACMRCPIPNIDQESGVMDGISSKVLRGRKGTIPKRDGTLEDGIFFGQNLNHVMPTEGQARLSIGDAVEVLEWADRPNVRLAA